MKQLALGFRWLETTKKNGGLRREREREREKNRAWKGGEITKLPRKGKDETDVYRAPECHSFYVKPALGGKRGMHVAFEIAREATTKLSRGG